MRRFKIAPVQWGAGSYCAFNGLLMLVTPHQFLSPGYAALQPQLWLWGLLFLLAGSFMLSAVMLKISRRATIIAHLLTGASLLLLAMGFISSQIWSGTINLALLGLGTLIATLPAISATRDRHMPTGDLLSLLVGLGMIANGLLMLLAPTQYSAPLYTPIRPFLAGFGLAFVLGGALLAYLQIRPARQEAGAFVWIAHLLGAAVLFSFLPLVIVGQVWSGIPYYGLIAILVSLTPWHGSIGGRIDGGTLRTRLAVAMALVAAVPLVLMTAWFSGRAEQETRQAALEHMQILAGALASSMQNYALEHRNAVLTLASNHDLMALAPAEQRSLLQISARSYPDIVAFSTFDPDGKPIARSDNLTPTTLVPALRSSMQAAGGPIDTVIMSPLLHRPVFVFAAPSMRSDGSLAGYIVVAVESTRVSEALVRSDLAAGGIVYLVDYTGRVIAHPDKALVARFTDLRDKAPVAALLERPGASGALGYGSPATERLAGYARVPDMGWGVIIEQPVAIALAATRTAREQLLILVVIFLAAAALAGVLVARGMTAPISHLVAATSALAGDEKSAPLPVSGIRELDRLAEAFSETRERIAARTAESTQTRTALQTLNRELEGLVTKRTEALNQTNATLEQNAKALERSNSELAQFAYVASHDLQEPLRMMASYSQLLARRYQGQIDEKADQYISYITEGANRMQHLIEDLLAYARLGRETRPTTTVSVEAALGQALDNLQLVVSNNDATVNHERLPDAHGDVLLLTLIFQNLIHNAIKFHGVQKPVISVAAVRCGEFWEICVRDNGIGIEPQYQERIFTIFQRLHTRQEYPGNGIGLAAVKKMVEQNGGNIRLESARGEGTAFFFTVQAPKEAALKI